MTKDLQKQIEELEKILTPYERTLDFICADPGAAAHELNEALSIIKQLQDEADKYKILWESDAEDSKAIIAELENENKFYIQCLRRINSCDDSASQQSRDAHQVLKQFGKL